MASKESLGRVRHLNLISQQLRLRHLRSISVRNVVPKFPVSGSNLLDRLLETYFTLHHVKGHQKAIYTSEKIKYSLNPTWASFEPSSWKEQQPTAMNSFVVRVWGGQHDNFQLIIEWEVHLPSLQYLGDQVRASHHGRNTVIFGLVDGYYGAPQTPTSTTEGGDSSEVALSLRKHAMKVDSDQVDMSYKVSSVLRMQAMQKAIQQAQLSVRDVRKSIENKVESAEKCTSQLSEEEMLKLKVKNLREELLVKGKLLFKEQEEEKRTLDRLRKREMDLKTKNDELDTNNAFLRQHKQAHIEKRESLVRLNAQLNMRRRQLISELMYIYPITEFPHRGVKEFLLCGVRLPNCESDDFSGMDEETLSVALGYACHLVCMIAKFLELPLRYPMNSRGSRSNIMDFTIEKVADKDRKFPLYNKGKEKIQFDYGVFLLNKNIAQLRQFCGLGTPNLRNTVPNLKDLLDTKFQSSEAVKSAPLTIIRKPPLKHDKKRSPNSSGSGESPPPNPKLDDVLLRTMIEARPSSSTQLGAPQQYKIQNPGNPANGNFGNPFGQAPICLPSETNGDKAVVRTVSEGNALHIPGQSSTHRFLEQQRVKKSHKQTDNDSKAKVEGSAHAKLHRTSTAGKHKAAASMGNVMKGGVSDSAANSKELITFERNDHLSNAGRRNKDGASIPSGQRSHAQSDSAVRNELLRHHGVPVEQARHQEPRSTSLFDLQGSINFDIPENGEIDLR